MSDNVLRVHSKPAVLIDITGDTVNFLHWSLVKSHFYDVHLAIVDMGSTPDAESVVKDRVLDLLEADDHGYRDPNGGAIPWDMKFYFNSGLQDTREQRSGIFFDKVNPYYNCLCILAGQNGDFYSSITHASDVTVLYNN